ncbi:DUF2075 domain-containing protein [Nocardia rhamnosiphila]|uniref:DUF2075 domain-containing protein n=1 Tax=Nocardia rhamnosiphila TaxID=426716 RepID=UPI0004C471A8|nr:DUF2075 domain-containing protein [Nocardia rhamnosiphila]
MTLRAFHATALEILNLSREGNLAVVVAERAGRNGNTAERRSWESSLPALAQALVEADLQGVSMLIECSVPSSTKRVDAVLAGVHPATGDHNYVVVELKQWTDAGLGWNSNRIVWTLHTRGDQLHPVEQVRGYCRYLQRDLVVLHNHPEALHGVAYLHNALRKSVEPLFHLPPDNLGRLFTGGHPNERNEFIHYLKTQFTSASGHPAGVHLLNSETRRRRTLLSSTTIARMTTEHTLIENQRLAFEAVRNRVSQAHDARNQSVVIVTGGPGSGTTLIALSLLQHLRKDGRRVLYATGSQAITKTYRRIYGRQDRGLEKQFTYYRSLASLDRGRLDVVICDEAHGILRESTDRFTRTIAFTKRPQVDEIMAAARVPVFLLDDHQVVHPNQVGTVEYIRNHAARAGFSVFQVDLDGQFRCGGSAAFDEWVLNLLSLNATGPIPWKADGIYNVYSARSPKQMEDYLRSKITPTCTARITAGYCWDWSINPDSNGALVPDVTIGNWSRPWHKAGEAMGTPNDPPPSWLWATDPRGFDQVGTIHSTQGFEFDWTGVILGPEIVAENGRLVVRREANKDRRFKRKDLFDEEVDILIRNTYKVLLTRGMRGLVIYSADPDTQEFIAGLADSIPQA